MNCFSLCTCVLLLFNAVCYSPFAGPYLPARHEVITFTAETWPEADALFRKDPYWLGGDDAYSVNLGQGRVLWLFADSFIGESPARVRREAKLIRNSVAIQQGYDPSAATIKFYWRTPNGKAASFFPESGDVWFWPGHGIRLGNTLLIFLMKVRKASTALGFEVFGWEAVRIKNPEEEPSNWKVRRLNPPQNQFGVIIGSASILLMGEYICAFGAEEPGIHDVYIVRWRVTKAAKGDLSEPEWWSGQARAWVRQSALRRRPVAVFSDAQTEFTVHYDPGTGRYIQIQTKGFADADIAMRWSSSLTGPWSVLESCYRPGEADREGVLIYAGKAHPELVGADLVLTYVVNSKVFDQLLNDTSIYYPRFLRGKFKQSG